MWDKFLDPINRRSKNVLQLLSTIIFNNSQNSKCKDCWKYSMSCSNCGKGVFFSTWLNYKVIILPIGETQPPIRLLYTSSPQSFLKCRKRISSRSPKTREGISCGVWVWLTSVHLNITMHSWVSFLIGIPQLFVIWSHSATLKPSLRLFDKGSHIPHVNTLLNIPFPKSWR